MSGSYATEAARIAATILHWCVIVENSPGLSQCTVQYNLFHWLDMRRRYMSLFPLTLATGTQGQRWGKAKLLDRKDWHVISCLPEGISRHTCTSAHVTACSLLVAHPGVRIENGANCPVYHCKMFTCIGMSVFGNCYHHIIRHDVYGTLK